MVAGFFVDSDLEGPHGVSRATAEPAGGGPSWTAGSRTIHPLWASCSSGIPGMIRSALLQAWSSVVYARAARAGDTVVHVRRESNLAAAAIVGCIRAGSRPNFDKFGVRGRSLCFQEVFAGAGVMTKGWAAAGVRVLSRWRPGRIRFNVLATAQIMIFPGARFRSACCT